MVETLKDEDYLHNRDPSFKAQITEFLQLPFPITILGEFAEYLMTARKLHNPASIDDYGTVSYERRNREKATFHSNHGAAGILQGLKEEKWNLNDILHSIQVYVGKEELAQRVEEFTSKDFSVEFSE
jgi:hypothetical protein